MNKFIENVIGLAVYVVLGYVCLLKLVGLGDMASFGLGLLFGNIMGVLNEIHRDLTKLLKK